jgi:transketolase
MQVFLPSDIFQTQALVKALIDHPHPAYIRVGRNAVPNIYDEIPLDFRIGQAQTLLDGDALTLIGTGETVWHCLQAGKRLHAEGIRARVIDMHSLKPFDRETVERAARETHKIITVEEHSIFGGLGAAVAEVAAQTHPVPLRILGIPDENAINGTALEIFHHYGIDSDGIYRTAKECLNSKL